MKNVIHAQTLSDAELAVTCGGATPSEVAEWLRQRAEDESKRLKNELLPNGDLLGPVWRLPPPSPNDARTLHFPED